MIVERVGGASNEFVRTFTYETTLSIENPDWIIRSNQGIREEGRVNGLDNGHRKFKK